MEKLIAVYLEDVQTGGQSGFEFYEDEESANEQLDRVRADIAKYGKEDVFKAVKREVEYDRRNNRVSFN